MKQISKALAEEIASKLVAHIEKERNDLIRSTSKFLESKYLSQVNPKIAAMWDTHSSWMNTGSYCVVYSESGLRKELYLENSVPRGSNSCPVINLSDQEFDIMIDSFNKRDLLYNKHRKLYSEIVSTLLALRTPNKIRESFIEAYNLIPADSLSGNISYLPVDINKLKEDIRP